MCRPGINLPESQEGRYLRYASSLVTATYDQYASFSGLACLDLDLHAIPLRNLKMINNQDNTLNTDLMPETVTLIGIPFDEYSSFMRGPAKAPSDSSGRPCTMGHPTSLPKTGSILMDTRYFRTWAI
jgi:hypothetical protein